MKKSMIFLRTFIAFAIFTLITLSTQAGVLIEPHFGYVLSGNADRGTDKTKFNGPEYGARLGAQKYGLMGGLDYTHSSFTYKTTAGSIGNDDKKHDQVGAFIGYKFPILVRIWGTYYFYDKTTQTANGANENSGYWTKGHGSELGVGYTGLPFLSVNLQYRQTNHDTQSGTNSSLNPTWKTSEVVLGISIPLNLP